MKRLAILATILCLVVAAAAYWYLETTSLSLSRKELSVRALRPSSLSLGKQGADLALRIEKVSPTEFGYDVTVTIANVGIEPAFLAVGGPNGATWLQSLAVEQWDNVLGWQSVGPCHDIPPYETRLLAPGASTQDIVPIGDTCHGFSSAACLRKIERLGGKIRAVLYVYGSDSEFRERMTKSVTPKQFTSPPTQVAEPLHAAARDMCPTRIVQPSYPVAAKKAGVQGTVLLEVTVGEDGKVTDIDVLSGRAVLALAATDAVRKWEYRPYSSKSYLIPKIRRVTVNFELPKTITGDARK